MQPKLITLYKSYLAAIYIILKFTNIVAQIEIL